jgi:hypothetical protein
MMTRTEKIRRAYRTGAIGRQEAIYAIVDILWDVPAQRYRKFSDVVQTAIDAIDERKDR